MNDFNPNDPNAMLQKLLSHAESHGEALKRLEAGHGALGVRVTELEEEKWYNRGVVAAMAIAAAGAWEWAKTRF